MNQGEQDRVAARQDLDGRLSNQRYELRAEIQRATRQGWQLIVAGLAWSAVGTAIGIGG